MAYIVSVDEREFKVSVERAGRNFIMQIDGRRCDVEIVSEDENQMTLIVDDRPFVIVMDAKDQIQVSGETYRVSVIDENVRKLVRKDPSTYEKRELVLKAVMPGLVIDINVREGDPVKAGEALLVVEAMKMQNEVKTTQDGVVKKLFVQKGKAVNSGDTLIVIE